MSTNISKPRFTILCATSGDATTIANYFGIPGLWTGTQAGPPTVSVSGTTVTILGDVGGLANLANHIVGQVSGLSADVTMWVDQAVICGP